MVVTHLLTQTVTEIVTYSSTHTNTHIVADNQSTTYIRKVVVTPTNPHPYMYSSD